MMQRFSIIVLIVLFAAGVCMQARAADDEPDPGLSSPFTLIILGTRSASDIELIRKNIKSLAYIKGFSPSQVSQRHLEFTGSFVGSEETFLADIESLSADRFEVNSKDDRERGLVVTLRKIQPVPVE